MLLQIGPGSGLLHKQIQHVYKMVGGLGHVYIQLEVAFIRGFGLTSLEVEMVTYIHSLLWRIHDYYGHEVTYMCPGV